MSCECPFLRGGVGLVKSSRALTGASLPLAFYLKLFGKEISAREKAFDYFLIIVCSILSLVGTVWAFLPKSLIGAD